MIKTLYMNFGKQLKRAEKREYDASAGCLP